MPRSPSDGAQTRSAADIEYPAHLPGGRQNWARSGRDRRVRDVGPPEGIERRSRDRRIADRRRGADRRRVTRRADGTLGGATASWRAAFSRPTPRTLPRAASREYGPLPQARARTPKILRALLVTAVAVGCLLAATLQEAHGATVSGSASAASAARTAAKTTTGVVVKSSGGVRATLSYTRSGSSTSGGPIYRGLRLTVRAKGRTTLRRLAIKGRGATGYLTRPQLTVREVTGDGVPDVIVDVYTGGAHCCSISSIVRSTPKSWSRPITHDWADHGYQLRDAGGSSTPEFIADDPRFTGAYASYAAGGSPIRIYSAEGGTLRAVTTQFPDWIRLDVKRWEQQWNDAAKQTDPEIVADVGRGAAAAWIADLSLLGEYDAAKAVYAAALARGDLDGFAGFGGQLGHDLRAFGYLADPALVGLPDAPVS